MPTINIRLMSNASTFSIEVESWSLTVLELKQSITGADKADCEAERQKLVYKGKILKDDDTLASYGACRLPGGLSFALPGVAHQ